MSIKPAHVALIPVFAIASMLAACKEQAPAQGAGAAPAPLVGIVTLEAKPYALTTELPGRTAAYRSAEVRPQVNGIIQKRLFEEGSEVKAGQQLYQIDAAVYEATLKSAEATLLPPARWPSAMPRWSRTRRSASRPMTRRVPPTCRPRPTSNRRASMCVTPRCWRRSMAASVAPR